MIPPPLPPNEEERLAALRRLVLLDTPASESFDRITRQCARILRTPIALVSLVDERRQWFKSRFGLDVPETPREFSFCGHAVAADELLVVPDATLDPRFADNPLVTTASGVRAYLGVPIHAPGGEAIGTLCAIDRSPRQFSDADIVVMTRMARIVEHLIQSRQTDDHAAPAG